MDQTLTKVVNREPKFTWDEPKRASTPRGWCSMRPSTHPDRDHHAFDYFTEVCSGLGVGNYLDYGPTSARGPNGETIHAVAYYHYVTTNGSAGDVRLGYCWVNSITEAKEFIEGNIRAYLGFPRS